MKEQGSYVVFPVRLHLSSRGVVERPEYRGQTFKRQVFGLPVWIHIYESGNAERRLRSKIEKDRAKFESDLKILTNREYACEPDANTDLLVETETGDGFYPPSVEPFRTSYPALTIYVIISSKSISQSIDDGVCIGFF